MTVLDGEVSFNASALQECRVEICNAIYGPSNPDICGIGVRSPSHFHRNGDLYGLYLEIMRQDSNSYGAVRSRLRHAIGPRYRASSSCGLG